MFRDKLKILALMLLCTPVWSGEGEVLSCSRGDGSQYFSDNCGVDRKLSDVSLGETTRLDPALENPVAGLFAYYSPFVLKLKIKLRELGVLEN